MSQEFNFKYDQIRENEYSIHDQKVTSKTLEDSYDQIGYMRNVCFVEANGKRTFLNYSYLVSGEFVPEDNIIILNYSSHVIKIKGLNIESLFYNFMQQLVKQIVCTNPRYNLIGGNESFVINDMVVIKNAP